MGGGRGGGDKALSSEGSMAREGSGKSGKSVKKEGTVTMIKAAENNGSKSDNRNVTTDAAELNWKRLGRGQARRPQGEWQKEDGSSEEVRRATMESSPRLSAAKGSRGPGLGYGEAAKVAAFGILESPVCWCERP